jgi:hypothetical protein
VQKSLLFGTKWKNKGFRKHENGVTGCEEIRAESSYGLAGNVRKRAVVFCAEKATAGGTVCAGGLAPDRLSLSVKY